MPEQKYKQNGGEKYIHTQQAETDFSLEIKMIKKEYTQVPIPTIPTINKKEAWGKTTENVEEKTDEDGKPTENVEEKTDDDGKPTENVEENPDEDGNTTYINIVKNDIPIKKYGFTYQDNNITAHNFELLFEDRNKLYGVDGDNGIGRGNLMKTHNGSNYDIKSYIQHVVNIYNHYVPLRTQIFPEYAKHIPSMKYKIKNETDGETEEGKTEEYQTKEGEKDQERKNTENVLKIIMTMFSEVTIDKDGNPIKDKDGKPITKTVIEQLRDFIVNEGDKEVDNKILDRYKKTLNEIYKNDDVESKIESDNNLFKILTVFAWEKSDKIMEQYEKSLKDQEEKEKAATLKAMQEADKQDNRGGSGSGDLTKNNGESRFTLSPAQRAYRRRAVFLCFLSFVWNSWLLFSTLFSVYSFMTRILDLRQDYIDRGIGDFGETESGNIFFSWFSVMQEIFTIGIVEMSTNIAQRSVTMAQSLANNTIDSLRYQGHLSWERGFAIYMNDLMSGVLTWSGGISAEMNFQRSVNELMFEIRQTGLDLRTHAYSINNAITNSIGGMSATTMVLLRVLYPEEVPQMSSGAAVTLNLISNWVPVVGPVVSSIANSAYVGYTLYDLHTRHDLNIMEITQESLSTLLEQLQNTPADIRLLFNGLYRRPLAIEDAPTGAVATVDTVPEPNPDPNTNHEGGSRGKKRSYKKGRKGKQVKKNRSYRRK